MYLKIGTDEDYRKKEQAGAGASDTSPDMIAAITAMLKVREKYILKENTLLFAVSGSARSTTGWVALKAIVG